MLLIEVNKVCTVVSKGVIHNKVAYNITILVKKIITTIVIKIT